MLLTQEDLSSSETSPLTAGQLLKQARQAKGVHLAVLAVTLKVPVRQLEALEADQYDAFKGGPSFLRAITSSMCRHLGVDAAPVLALLPSAVSSMATRQTSLEPLNGLQRATLQPSWRMPSMPSMARPVLLLASLMLLGTAAFLWVPSPDTWWPGASTESAAIAVDDAAVPLGQASNPETTDEALAPTLAVASEPLPTAAGLAAHASVTSTFVPPPAVSPAPSAATVAQTPATLHLQATADSWVEVRDAKGPVLSQLLKSGEALEIKPSTPYSVVIGRAVAVKATLRGQPFDLKPHTPQTVARFEVKE